MIKLSRQKYKIHGVSQKQFWSELDNITAGQAMNPEFGYTTQHLPNFDNVFAGRRKDNKFSVYLYRPMTNIFRTEILAKGIVTEKKDLLLIESSFELPFWSVIIFLIIGSIIFIPLYFTSFFGGIVFSLIGLFIYSIVVDSNYSKIKKELKKQIDKIEEKNLVNSK